MIGEGAILAAADLCKARTRPRTLRAFFDARFPVDASFRDLLRRASDSGEGQRGSPVAVSRSPLSDAPTLGLLAESGRDICSEDRSGQVWKLDGDADGGGGAASFPTPARTNRGRWRCCRKATLGVLGTLRDAEKSVDSK